MRNGRPSLWAFIGLLSFLFGCTATQAPSPEQARKETMAIAAQEEQIRMEMELAHPLEPSLPTDRATLGKADAPITIVEYADFQCPFCKKAFDTLQEVKKLYAGKVRFVYKNTPLPFHRLALPAAKRFEAIVLQSPDKAYKYHDAVFGEQDRLAKEGEGFLDLAAQKAGADLARMKKDMASEKVSATLQSDAREAERFEISGTPGFIVNGVSMRGVQPLSKFKELIEKTLARTQKPSLRG